MLDYVAALIIETFFSYILTELVGSFRTWITSLRCVSDEEGVTIDVKLLPLSEKSRNPFVEWLQSEEFSSFLKNPANVQSPGIFLIELQQKITEKLRGLGEPNNSAPLVFRAVLECALKDMTESQKLDIALQKIMESHEAIAASNEKLNALLSQDQPGFFTPLDVDFLIRTKTKAKNRSGYLSIDSFEIDDRNAIESLIKLLSTDYFFVSYYAIEEALLLLLNALRRLAPDKPVYVISEEKSWPTNSIGIENAIFICAFSHEKPLTAIENNTTIFLLGEGKRGANGETIVLERRKIDTIKEGLKKTGFSEDEATHLMYETGGFFFPLLANLWQGDFPLYRNQDYAGLGPMIKALLVFPEFHVNGDEASFVKNLSGMGDKEFEKGIETLTSGNSPVLERILMFGKVRAYRVIAPSALWSAFGSLMDDTSFDECAHRFFQLLLSEKSLSSDFVHETAKSLSFATCVYQKAWQKRIDFIARSYFSTLPTDDVDKSVEWLTDLVEVSPDACIEFIENHKKQFGEQFQIQENRSPFCSTVVRGLLEIARYNDKNIEEAFSLCAYFANEEAEENRRTYGPTATSALAMLLYPWFNFAGLPVEKREELCGAVSESFPKKTHHCVETALSLGASAYFGEGRHYRPQNETMEVSQEDHYRFRSFLVKLFLEGVDQEERINLLFKLPGLFIPYPKVENWPNEIAKYIEDFDDSGKFERIQKLRKFLFSARYHEKDYFQKHEDFLQEIESIINEVRYDDIHFNYLFIFQNEDYPHYHILNPVPFQEEKTENDVLETQLIQDTFEEINNSGISWTSMFVFLKKRGIKDDYWFGKTMGRATKKFDKTLYRVLGSKGYPDGAAHYGMAFCKGARDIERLLEITSNPSVRANLLCTFELTPAFLSALEAESKEVQDRYWASCQTPTTKDKETAEEILAKLFEYKKPRVVIRTIHTCFDLFEPREIPPLLLTALKEADKQNALDEYEAYGIMTKLHGLIDEDENSLETMAEAELLTLRTRHTEPLYFTSLYCRKNARFYAKICDLVFSSGDKKDFIISSVAINHSILRQLHVIPGEVDGIIRQDEFKRWVEAFDSSFESQDKEFVRHICLAKVLLDTPKGEDGLPLEMPILEFIETCEDSWLKDEISVTLQNNVGAHQVDGGETLRNIANGFAQYASALRKHKYFACARIYEEVRDSFLRQAEDEEAESRHVRR